jgi:hypothetical protein
MSDEKSGSSDSGYGGPIIVLYAVALQQAKQSGDVARMRKLAEQARTEGSNDPEIQSALKELEAEIARASGGGS